MYSGASKRKIFRIISRGIIYGLVFSLLCPQQALASRSSAGGGKIAKPDWGRVATNVGIVIGSAIVMNSLGNAWKAAQPVAAGAQTGAQVGTQVGAQVGTQVGTQAMTMEGMNCFAQAWLAEPAIDFVSTAGTQAMTIEGMNCLAQAWLAEPAIAINSVSTVNTSLSLIDRVGSTIGNIGSGIKNLVTNNAGGGVTVTNAAGQVTAVRPLTAAWNSMTSLETVMPTVVKGYATFTAGTQVARAVGMAGQYYEWSPRATFAISSMAVGATGGFLNPSAALGETLLPTTPFGSAMIKGAFVGGLSGWATGATIGAIDGDRLNKGKSPGVGAQIAGMTVGILATDLGRIIVDPQTYNTVWGEFHKTEGNIWERTDGSGYMTDAELKQQAGMDSLEKQLRNATRPDGSVLLDQELTFGSASKLVEDSRVVSYEPGQKPGEMVLSFKNTKGEPLKVPMELSQLHFLTNIEVGPNNRISIPLPEVSPTGSQVANRIFLEPLALTVDDWALIVSGSIAIAVTNKMDSKWAPLVSEVISATATPFFDSLATAYNLRIHTATNLDQKLGYAPKAKYAREEVFQKAAVYRVAKAVSALNLKDPLRESLEARDIIDRLLYPHLSNKQREDILTKFKTAQDYAKLNELPFDKSEYQKVLSKAIVDEFRIKTGDASNEQLFRNMGGSKSEIVLTAMKNVATYDLPIALISGGIQVGLNSMIDNDSSGAMLASLAGVVASSIARGIVVNINDNIRYDNQLRKMREGESNPLELATALTLQDPADIVIARLEGRIPWADPQRYTPGDIKYIKGWSSTQPDELSEKKVDQIRDKAVKASIDLGWGNIDAEVPLYEIPQQIEHLTKADIQRTFETKLKEQELFTQYEAYIRGEKIQPEAKSKIADLKMQAEADVELRIERAQLNPILNQLNNITPKFELRQLGSGEKGGSPLAPVTDIGIASQRVFVKEYLGADGKVKGEVIGPGHRDYGRITKISGWTFDLTGTAIAPLGRYTLGDKRVMPYDVAEVPSLAETIGLSLGQGLYEFGWQSLAMGLPHTKDGKLGAYAWVNYQQTLRALTSAASARGVGIFATMAQHTTGVGKDVIERNILTTISATPLGNALGMAQLAAVKNYKGMSVSWAVIIETGYREAKTMFYPYSPYYRMNIVPNDAYWRHIKISTVAHATGQKLVPEPEQNSKEPINYSIIK